MKLVNKTPWVINEGISAESPNRTPKVPMELLVNLSIQKFKMELVKKISEKFLEELPKELLKKNVKKTGTATAISEEILEAILLDLDNSRSIIRKIFWSNFW